MNTPSNTRALDSPYPNTYNLNDIVSTAVAQAIQQYENQRSHLENATGSGSSAPKGGEDMPSKYRERVKVGIDAVGDPVYQWACGDTKEELHSNIFRLLSATTTTEQQSPNGNNSWEQYADHWFNVFHVKKVRKKTLSKDESLFRNHVRSAFADIAVSRITASDVQSYLETKSHYCKSQVRDIMAMMKSVFSLIVESGVLPRNPMDSTLVFNPSVRPDRPRAALSPEHQADIIAHLDDLRNVRDKHGDSLNALRFMAFLMFTCLRPCEIFGLRWEDINAKDKTITICRDLVFVSGMGILGKPKTEDSARTIPFDERLLQYIAPIGESGFVLHMTERGRENEHFTETASVNMWNRIKRNIDVHGMTPYMGRHTFASNMSRSGVPLKSAMAMMGHKDERMLLRRYTHVNERDLTEASKIVANYMSNVQRPTA